MIWEQMKRTTRDYFFPILHPKLFWSELKKVYKLLK